MVDLVSALLALQTLHRAASSLASKVTVWSSQSRFKFRRLTQQDNEVVAAAEAQPTLFALNAFLLYVAAIFIAVFCLSVFG